MSCAADHAYYLARKAAGGKPVRFVRLINGDSRFEVRRRGQQVYVRTGERYSIGDGLHRSRIAVFDVIEEK